MKLETYLENLEKLTEVTTRMNEITQEKDALRVEYKRLMTYFRVAKHAGEITEAEYTDLLDLYSERKR